MPITRFVSIAAPTALCLILTGCAAQTALTHRHLTKTVVTTGDWVAPEDERMDPTIPPFDPLHAAGSGDQVKARFRGTDRKVAKIAVVGGAVHDEGTVDALASTLASDDAMRSHNPPLTTDSDCDRVSEERRNVKIKAWVYAIKYEADQDWHLIVGTDPGAGPVTYFNCEVSGLPAKTASDYNALLNVRQDFAAILDNDLPGPSAYTQYEPFEVTIQGSLFYDVDHAAGAVGPSGMKPNSSWEVHPISKIAWAQ